MGGGLNGLTHWGLHWVIIGLGNGLAPFWCQAITWTNVDPLSNWTLKTVFNKIWIKIVDFRSGKWISKCLQICRPFWRLIVLIEKSFNSSLRQSIISYDNQTIVDGWMDGWTHIMLLLILCGNMNICHACMCWKFSLLTAFSFSL